MSETTLHLGLSRLLCIEVAHSATLLNAHGHPSLPDPYAIGDHEPDLIAYRGIERLVGEAKRGPDLLTAHTLEQLRDFTTVPGPFGLPSRLILGVPPGYELMAAIALARSGGDPSRAEIVTLRPRLVRRRRARRPRRAPRAVRRSTGLSALLTQRPQASRRPSASPLPGAGQMSPVEALEVLLRSRP
jgi:hypothetical protein